MKTEFLTFTYLILIGALVIGTNINQDFINKCWFAIMWSALITSGVYIVLNTKSEWAKKILSMFIGWMFSALVFEVIILVQPELSNDIDKPSATYVWYLIAFMIGLTIITLTNGKTTPTGDSNASE